MPTVVHHEPEAARLVLGTPGGARDWHEHHTAARFPRTPARVLGRTLASSAPAPGRLCRGSPARRRPDVGSVAPRAASRAAARPQRGSPGSRGSPAGEPRRCAAGSTSSGRPAPTARSCTVTSGGTTASRVPAPGSRRRTRVLLVDWELAGRGAAGFDVGTVLAEYLRCWVGSIPIVEPGDPGRLVARARHPLRRMQPAIHAFWSAYGLANPQRPTLRRVIELAAVRLLQTAVERAQGLVTPSAHVVTLVQLADNMLRHPDDAALEPAGAARVTVSRYREQVAAALEAVTIRGPTRYAWLGRASRPLPASSDARAGRVRAPQLPRLVPARGALPLVLLPRRSSAGALGRARAGLCGPVAGRGDVAGQQRARELGARVDGRTPRG